MEEEELEEGELSDDEGGDARKERLKPQPVCRFYSKGQCTWGNSCRFMHPGVLDKGNYSMFSEPKPILPGAEQVIEMEQESVFFVMQWQGFKQLKSLLRMSPSVALQRGQVWSSLGITW